MNSVSNGNRKHIGIFGNVNSGKSSLINSITGQDISIVSEEKGTTTDAVRKPMEIIGMGPVVLIDTAGINDDTTLGQKRVDKTLKVLMESDLALYIFDGTNLDFESFEIWKLEAKKYNVDFITIVNKLDLISEKDIELIKDKIENPIFVSTKTQDGMKDLIDKISEKIDSSEQDKSLIGDLLHYGSTVVLVVPIDSEAPKGRLILPQVQLIRDCLDNGLKAHVVRDTELSDTLKELQKVDLVVTDSQAFKKVSELVPDDINLTSFSILFARQKGDLKTFVDGALAIKSLKPGNKVLMAESCTHNSSHEDIGRVKIPKMLEKAAGGKLDFTFKVGKDFDNEVSNYDLVVHCGGCMINRKTVINRVLMCKKNNVPITNYGLVLAYLTGILKRATNNLV